MRAVIISGVAGLFLGLAGAFGSGALPLAPRLLYWIGLMVGGSGLGVAITEASFKIFRRRRWVAFAAGALVISLIYTGIVWLLNLLVFGPNDPEMRDHPIRVALELFPMVLAVSVVLGLVHWMAEQHAARALAAAEPTVQPRFLERLPLRLRGAEIHAVQSEDHYLRIHTDRGSDLILMRLSDAIAELEGLEGAQTHRSWWVARAAVIDVRRSDGRASLTLKSGAEAPVSRSYAPALRQAGWY